MSLRRGDFMMLCIEALEVEARRQLAILGMEHPKRVSIVPIYEGDKVGAYLTVENDNRIYGVTMPVPDMGMPVVNWLEKYLIPAVNVVHMNLVGQEA